MHINETAAIQKSCSQVERLTFPLRKPSAIKNFDASDYLKDELALAESIVSSQLEGAATTSRVAIKMLKIGRKPRDEGERMIMGNWRMMQFVAARGDAPVDIKELLKLHRVAIADIDDEKYSPGQLRKPNDEVVVADHEGNIIHTPPDAGLLPNALKNLCEFINIPHEKPMMRNTGTRW